MFSDGIEEIRAAVSGPGSEEFYGPERLRQSALRHAARTTTAP